MRFLSMAELPIYSSGSMDIGDDDLDGRPGERFFSTTGVKKLPNFGDN